MAAAAAARGGSAVEAAEVAEVRASYLLGNRSLWSMA